MYPIEINLLIMFYLTSKFHDNCFNTFGFMEIGNRPRNSKKGGSDWGWGLGGGEWNSHLSVTFLAIFQLSVFASAICQL